MKRKIYLIAHDIRSAYNVGALFRLSDGLGIQKLFLTGYTPHPSHDNDNRLPHIAQKLDKQITKTALGSEKTVNWSYEDDILDVLSQLRANKVKVVALEQTADAKLLTEFSPPEEVAILLGSEVKGIKPELLKLCNESIEIPMLGKKESHNVVQAAAMAAFYCRFADDIV